MICLAVFLILCMFFFFWLNACIAPALTPSCPFSDLCLALPLWFDVVGSGDSATMEGSKERETVTY